MKLNLYIDRSIESSRQIQEAISDGIDNIGQFVGGITLKKSLGVKLPKIIKVLWM